MKTSSQINAYIEPLAPEVQVAMQKIRKILHKATPKSGEGIKYQMPMITIDGQPLVYFAAWKKHIGMYPIPRGNAAFERRLAPHRDAKDTVKFFYDEPIPYDLIRQIAELVVEARLKTG